MLQANHRECILQGEMLHFYVKAEEGIEILCNFMGQYITEISQTFDWVADTFLDIFTIANSFILQTCTRCKM